MTPYKKIKEIDKILKEVKVTEAKYRKELYKLQRERTKAFMDYAMKGGLKESLWEVEFEPCPVENTTRVTLYSTYWTFPKLIKAAGEYLAATELTKGVTISVRDQAVSLVCESPTKAKSFIEKYELKVNFTNIKETHSNIAKEYNKISTFLTEYGVTIDEI